MSYRRLYRSTDALVGGVCAGVAERLDADTIILRIVAVVLTLVSFGLFALVYLGLWIFVPKATKPSRPFDVEPQAVHSETYGRVEWGMRRSREDCGDARRTDRWADISPSSPSSPRTRVSGDGGGDGSSVGVRVALWSGSLILFCAGVVLLANSIEGVAWWRYWPLLLMIVGLVRMIVPSEPGLRMRRFVYGLALFFLGATMLAMSVGIVSWRSFSVMFERLWPLLLATGGFFVLGNALRRPLLTLAGGVCFAAFCVVGLCWFSLPGPTDVLVLSSPFGWSHEFTLR